MKHYFFKAGAVLFCAVFAGSVGGQGLFAQSNPASAFDTYELTPASNTNKATEGRFSTDVDNFMGPTDWQGIELNKAFGFLGYGGGSRPVNAGFATKTGPLFLGAWYTGNIVSFDSADFVKTVDTTH